MNLQNQNSSDLNKIDIEFWYSVDRLGFSTTRRILYRLKIINLLTLATQSPMTKIDQD